MTAVLNRPADGTPLWNTMPGWGIVGDLTPPELINARRLHLLRRLIVAALGLVVVLCAAGYGYAMVQHSNASDDLGNASAQTNQLQQETRQYSGITRIESTVTGIKGQVASAMSGDVDVAKLVTRIRGALPSSMSIDNMTVTIASAATGGASSPGNAASLDLSGHTHIGTITLTGSAQNLDDLPTYIDELAALPGVADVLPTSNQVTTNVAQFTVSLAITDALTSHHFDVTAKGGK